MYFGPSGLKCATPYSGEFGPEYLAFYVVSFALSFSLPVTILEYVAQLNTNTFFSRVQTVVVAKAATHSPQRGVVGERIAERCGAVVTVRRVMSPT